MVMTEAVRLLVWDLDDTFWRGTVSEGGITEYIQEHHDIVLALAKRGIMSSICSKNDPDIVFNILKSKKILQYFIFPSISWESKGARVAAIINNAQLRPSTVMFIDDNAGNRAEVRDAVPSIQIEDESFIKNILLDARFIGKPDECLTRLTQYKLLETRKKDQLRTLGNDKEFLRNSDICVYIEYDVLTHIDRAIELINRTNQLNFTKIRLPEQLEDARNELRKDIDDHFRQCGLVKVMDKYGDYGFVGFFMIRNGYFNISTGTLASCLQHYCFSCRILGMSIEHWLYDHLQRPLIKITGEVLSDINEHRSIDWVRMMHSLSNSVTALPKLAPEIRVHGGCEANAVAHYLNGYSDRVVVTGNFHAGTNFVRVNGASLLLSACDRTSPEFQLEASRLDIPYAMLVNHYFNNPEYGAVFIFGGQLDIEGSRRYRHVEHGWELVIEPHGLPGVDLVNTSIATLNELIDRLPFSVAAKKAVASVAKHIHDHYESILFPYMETLSDLMQHIFDRIPIGSKLVIILDHYRVRTEGGAVIDAPWVREYGDQVRSIVDLCPFATVVSFTDYVLHDDEIHIGGNHYDRMVYYRMAEGILMSLREVPAKTEL